MNGWKEGMKGSCGTNTQWNIFSDKKNASESVLMSWMKLEPITQSEVSQKEKHQYSISIYIYIWNIYGI